MSDERNITLTNTPQEKPVGQKTANDPAKLERLVAAGRTTEPINWGELHDGLMIAYQLKQAREQMGLSLAEVEQISGIDRGQLSRLENGRTNPTFSTLARYASAIGKRFRFSLEDIEPEENSVVTTQHPIS